MSFWTAVVVIFIVGCITWLRTQKQRHLSQGSSARGQGERPLRDPGDKELEDEIAALRERINVLERIATDERRGKDLAREIESLRE